MENENINVHTAHYKAYDYSRDRNGNPTAKFSLFLDGRVVKSPKRRTQTGGYGNALHDNAEALLHGMACGASVCLDPMYHNGGTYPNAGEEVYLVWAHGMDYKTFTHTAWYQQRWERGVSAHAVKKAAEAVVGFIQAGGKASHHDEYVRVFSGALLGGMYV